MTRCVAGCLAFVLMVLPLRPAYACGGTFCDGPTPATPVPMLVDQTGENIIFVTDGRTVEAHIQVQYQGEASRFAWIIPMPTLPEFRVGSEMLFTEVLRATVPTYRVGRPEQ